MEKSLNPSLKKLLISSSEYKRLKSIEADYNNLQEEKKKQFDNLEGKKKKN